MLQHLLPVELNSTHRCPIAPAVVLGACARSTAGRGRTRRRRALWIGSSFKLQCIGAVLFMGGGGRLVGRK
jgi:hypothetical protein